MSINHEIRIEHATERGRRKPSQRLVKLPGEARHTGSTDSAENIARRIQLAKAEKRAKRG
ncbi:hypothetical protein [Sinorhizobium meliloti]|uniref:hypothetical protein n=1 Tax=Rhizobium meliloti TaxID=382 RepID=UPI0004213270|nr:hypothetical protein [Sinorhizobium meliloti]MQX19791.1 hypothetical protein [Sinorhizobium meliloti]RVG18553.1 hypothetical protein CN231_10335 [Sinorhizobium meliloti]RVP13388.1 hypothetical protein CN085_18510 [Sinorhizobium meliloti]UFX07394.1 hypothetical protein SmelRRI128_13070 [Sinorhizobium meliloti]